MKKNQKSLTVLQDGIKHPDPCVSAFCKGKAEERAELFPKFDQNYRSIDSKSSINPKQDKKKENYTENIIIKLLKTSGKETILKRAKAGQGEIHL